MRRHLAQFLCMLLTLTLCPAWAFAEEMPDTEESGMEAVTETAPAETERVQLAEDPAEEGMTEAKPNETEEPSEAIETENVELLDATAEEPERTIVESDALKAPVIRSLTYKSATSMLLKWDKVSGITGYEIQLDTSKKFTAEEPRCYVVENPDTTKLEIKDLLADEFYYARIRAFMDVSTSERQVSAWQTYQFAGSDFQTGASVVKSGSTAIDFHTYLPANIRKTYRVLQGTATDGTYLYLFYQSWNSSKCVILKVNASNFQKVAVSAPMVLNHANDATYNPDTGKLYVVHWDGSPFRISIVNPNSLKLEGHKDIMPPSSLKGATAKKLSAIIGYASIAYDSTRKQYALRCSGKTSLLILDKDLKPVRHASWNKSLSERPQSIDCDADHLYYCYDSSGSYNVIGVYDWGGNYEYRVRVPVKYELEGLVKVGSKSYASFYYGHYVKKYKTKQVKWKKVNGKWKYKTKYVYKTVKKKVKWKKVKGKWKYKKKKYKVKVTYTTYERQSFIYRLKSI